MSFIKVEVEALNSETKTAWMNVEQIQVVTTERRRRTRTNEEGKRESFFLDFTTIWFDSGDNREAYWDSPESVGVIMEKIQVAKNASK